MRTILVVSIIFLSVGLLAAAPVCAEEILVAKVYRDYPGYINPAVCENPNLEKSAAEEPVAQRPETSSPTGQPVAPSVVPMTPAIDKPVPVPAAVPVAPAINETAAPAATPVTPVSSNPPAAPAQEAVPVATEKKCDSAPYWAQSLESVSGPYLAAWAGMVATHDSDIDHDGDMSFDNGYGLGVAAGYDFGPARLEIEGSYRDSDIDEANDVGMDEDLTVQALMINGFADFETGGYLTPYLGAGIGYANVELADDDDNVLAGQLAAGVLIALSPDMALDLGYRFMATEDPDIDGTEFEVRQHTAMLGLQIRF